MLTVATFLKSLGGVLAVMAILAVLETFLPFFRSDWRKRHLATNLGLSSVTVTLNFVMNAGAVLVTSRFSTERGLASLPIPPLVLVMVSVVVLDATTYLCHRLMHVIPHLWAAHSVHHSDPLVDVTTALRFHPLETIWRFSFIVVPAVALGLPVAGLAAYRIVSVLFAVFEHANVKAWQPIDTALSFVFGTPNMHKLHHSRAESETNSNYGNILSLFDRALGTFTPSARAVAVRYGLE